MILYFADRYMNIIGQASTSLPGGLKVIDDLKTEDVETGVAVFECTIPYDEETRAKVEECTANGNYILRKNGDENEFYTIIDSEGETKAQSIYVYAEDAGLDLLNEVVGEYAASEAQTIEFYVNKFTKDSGFEIGINEIPKLTRKLSWDGESTVTERLASVATQFDGAEISYSFDIDNLVITNKYINIHKSRGRDIGVSLRLNKEIDNIITSKTIKNLATALICTGGTPEDSEKPITLEGYEYDDGDFYVEGKYLKSRKALKKWSRYIWNKEPNKLDGYSGHIVRRYSYDTTSQKTLCARAVTELKKLCEIEINYEVDITKFPENARIGDRVNIVDDAGQLYLSSRILKLETSVANDTHKATLGEHLIKSSGISQKVEDLAAQFAELAASRVFYTWIAYADDQYGAGITLDPEGKAYLGIATNKIVETPDISDPSVYSWSKIQGEQGPPGEAGGNGEDGRGVQAIVSQYYLSTSYEEPIGGEWSETMPEWQEGHYIWERQAVTWSDGETTYTDPKLLTALNHANEAADFAKDKAEETAQNAADAQQNAANAEQAAKDSELAAQEAAQKSQSAIETAGQAKEQAEDAQTKADAANEEIEQINGEISQVKEDAVALAEDIDAKITRVTETMEADYTKKSETEEIETTLRGEISKSAAQLQTTFEQDYAKKTDLTDVQADLQTQITQNAGEIELTAKAVEDVKADTTTAKEKADAASEAAAQAVATANTAKSEADAAQAAADTAAAAAQTAQSEADAAKQNADNAAQAAKDAQAVADAAQKDVETAEQQLATVQGRVDATEAEIAAAQAKVDEAKASAATAQQNANAASQAATQAQSAADTAAANAAQAQSDAEAAQTTANEAKTKADNAQASADQAQADLAELKNRVTTAETKITQNAEAIELCATKQEVTEELENYYTIAETEAKIKVASDSITSSVKSTYATKQEVEDIEIGGRNLYIGSADFSGGNWINIEEYTEAGTDSFGNVVLTKTNAWLGLFQEIQAKAGELYTLSANAKGDGTAKLWFYASEVLPDGTENTYGIKDYGICPTTETRFAETWEVKKDCILRFRVENSIAGFNLWVSSLKLEKGNKATDWTPAPEDMATGEEVENAQASADEANEGLADTNERLNTAESLIQQLSDSISMLVTDENGASLMTQTESGWTFSMAETNSTVNDMQQKLDTLQQETGDTQATVDALQQAVDDVGETLEYINITTYEDEPCIELGESDSDYKLMITNTRIMFRVGSNVPTLINSSGLVTENIEVKSELTMSNPNTTGNWVWMQRSNGHFSLQWKAVGE